MTEDVAASSFADIPLHLLRAELHRRQNDENERPECGSGAVTRNYNTPLHVFALFLILLLSTFACAFPLIVRRFPTLPVPNYALFLSRHFGTGVLIATAFVHLLPTAYVSLTDPCLPRFWNEVYPPMAGFVAMVSVLVVVGIEMGFAVKGAGGHSHGSEFAMVKEQGDRPALEGSRRSGSFRRFSQGPIGGLQRDSEEFDVRPALQRSPYSDNPGSVDKPLPPPPPFEYADDDAAVPLKARREDEEDSDLDLDELDPTADSDTVPLTSTTRTRHQPSTTTNGTIHPPRPHRTVSFAHPISSSIPHPSTNSNPQTTPADQRLILQCLLLEAGILFHSIFIGIALSVSTGTPFLVLLIAISFHQTFEGLALGSRIAAIPSFSPSSLKPWIMAAMYGITTPVGQAVGLVVHGFYDPEGEVGLLMVGVVNAVSAGLLLYAGLVQLLAEDFLSERSYGELRGWRRVEALGAVVGGSMLMALVGAFA